MHHKNKRQLQHRIQHWNPCSFFPAYTHTKMYFVWKYKPCLQIMGHLVMFDIQKQTLCLFFFMYVDSFCFIIPCWCPGYFCVCSFTEWQDLQPSCEHTATWSGQQLRKALLHPLSFLQPTELYFSLCFMSAMPLTECLDHPLNFIWSSVELHINPQENIKTQCSWPFGHWAVGSSAAVVAIVETLFFW